MNISSSDASSFWRMPLSVLRAVWRSSDGYSWKLRSMRRRGNAVRLRRAGKRARHRSLYSRCVDLAERVLVRSLLSARKRIDSGVREPWPFAHNLLMETKEHLFFITAILAFLLPITTREKLYFKFGCAQTLFCPSQD